jgi:mono/diheme cytochrome c family protein
LARISPVPLKRAGAGQNKLGRDAMTACRKALLACGPLLFLVAPVQAQQPAGAANPGKDMVASKCFQCHTDAMFRDGRQDRRGWEATIYRMVGRGGLWTQDEIKLMADYLGEAFGPNVKPAGAEQAR